MVPEETIHPAATGSKLVGATDKNPSELERAYANLDKQEALLNILGERLNPVSHNTPSEANNAQEKVSTYPHVSTIADRITYNNKRIDGIIGKLAV